MRKKRECWFVYCKYNKGNGICDYPKNKECPILKKSLSTKKSSNNDLKKVCPECGFAVRIQEAKLLPRHKMGCSMKGKPIPKS